MHEMILNLCTNAAYAMREHGGTLDVQLDTATVGVRSKGHPQSLRSRSHVRLTITDRGTGIPQHHLDTIFEPFFTTKGGEGTGMGLAVVGSIVERHGGTITVQSEPSDGAIFTVYLPRVANARKATRTKSTLKTRARILTDRAGDPLDRALGQLAIARVLLRTEGAKSAELIRAALLQAQTLVHQSGTKHCEPFIRVELAELARLTGDEAARKRELREAHRLFTEVGATAHASRVARQIS